MTDHLRLLLDRAAPLPPGLAARQRVWDRAVASAADALSSRLGTEVTGGAASLALTDTEACARGPAGILCPLANTRGFLQASERDAQRLAALLLAAEESADEPPVLLDALLVRSLASAVIDPVAQGFDPSLGIEDRHPLSGWPPAEESMPVLSVRLAFDLSGGPIVLTLYLQGSLAPFAAPATERPANPALRAAALASSCGVDAVVDSWPVSARDVAGLRPGQTLPLTGASVEALTLRVRTKAGAVTLGKGELGRAGGQQAVRLTEVA